MCSARMTSTVALNGVVVGCDASPRGVKTSEDESDEAGAGEAAREDGKTGDWAEEERPCTKGVAVPDAGAVESEVAEAEEEMEEVEGRWRASAAARRRRFVVPRAFVEPERAEHTMATLCWSR